MASLPLFVVSHQRLTLDEDANSGIWKVFLLAPVIMLANVAYAAVIESMITFFPLYGMHLGLSQTFSLGLLTIIAAGGMILVLPLGWVADHVNRLAMLVLVIMATMAGLLAFPFILHLEPRVIMLFAFFFGL